MVSCKTSTLTILFEANGLMQKAQKKAGMPEACTQRE